MSHWSYNIKIIFIISKCNYLHLTYLLFKIYYDQYVKFSAMRRNIYVHLSHNLNIEKLQVLLWWLACHSCCTDLYLTIHTSVYSLSSCDGVKTEVLCPRQCRPGDALRITRCNTREILPCAVMPSCGYFKLTFTFSHKY